MKRTLFLTGLLVLCLTGINRPVRAQTTPSHLYVMFLAGLCPWPGADSYCHGRISARARARSTFGTLIAAMNKAHLAYTPLYYSYDPLKKTYTVNETHQDIAVSAEALETELEAVRTRDPQAGFILVGHSLGGVVAASWAVAYPTTPAQSVITFDSPVRGVHGLSALAGAGRVFEGPVWSSLQPRSATIRAIVAQPGSWWQTVAHLHSVSNTADLIVPPLESTLGKSRTVSDRSCPRDFFFLRSCHGAVLSDAALNTWVVRHWMAAAAPVSAPPPPPSPVPTPTA